MKDIPVKEKAIERLRLEKRSAIGAWVEVGFTEGLKDAEGLSYEDFQSLLRGEIDNDLLESIHHDHFQVGFSDDEEKYRNEEPYLEGWKKGALHFWEQIKDQL